jgi:adenosylcobinamide kinase/adenosylcobinamide-phosphate guanylyltransferase
MGAGSGAREKIFIATAGALDREMADSIARRRRDRGRGYATIETPLELAASLRSACRPGRAVVVDCLTLWLSNLMHRGRPVERETADLLDAMHAAASAGDGVLILVSNEVGTGIAPEHAFAREFRDAHGRLNQRVAAAGRVELVTAGLPLILKPARSQ